MTDTDSIDRLLDTLGEICVALQWFQQRSDPLTAAEALADALDDWIDEQVGTASDSPSPEVNHSAKPTDRLCGALRSFHATVAQLQEGSGDPRITAAEALTQAMVGWTAVASMEHNRSTPFGGDPVATR